MASARDPEITIVMPVRNEARSIEATLECVLAQKVDAPFEVVVAEGRSSDGTRAIVERIVLRDPRVRLVDNPSGRTPQALNAALAAARGRYLVRVDGHMEMDLDYVQRLVDHLRSGGVEAAGGRKDGVGRGRFGRAVAATLGSRFGIGDSKYHYERRPQLVDHVPFGAYLTERAREIGGWDQQLVRNQDYDFDYRYGQTGARLLLDPSIVVRWHVRETPTGLARQFFQYGFWKFRTFARHPRSLHVRWLAPPVLVAALVFGAAFAWTRPGLLFLIAVAAAYSLFLVAGGVSLAARNDLSLAPHCMAALAILHLAWGTGFLLSALWFPFSPFARQRHARTPPADRAASRTTRSEPSEVPPR